MKRIIKRICFIFLLFLLIVLTANISQASGGLRLRNLDYDVQLNSDGTADVVETWRISIEDTNTLFKTFEVDSSKYSEITDVKVSEVTSSGEKDFTQVNQYQYHLNKDTYYGLIYNGKFEIAWGANAKNTTRTYKISYKIIDAIKNYNDCSEFYWQFISTDSEIPADLVKGTIKLPVAVANKEDLKVWAHGPLNGNIQIVSNDTVEFEVQDFDENTMLEARVVTPTNVFYSNQNVNNQVKLNSILEQEQKWADEANAKREELAKQEQQRKTLFTIGMIITNIIGVVVTIIVIKKIIKYHKILKETPIVKPEQEFEYYRDIPNESATPAQAGFLYYFKNSGLQYNMSKIISATMLDLCMKKYIEFEVIPDKKEQIKVIIKNEDITKLSEDEKMVYELLQKIPKKDTDSFTMKEFERYASSHSSSILNSFNKIEKIAKETAKQEGNYDEELIKKQNSWSSQGVVYAFLAVISIFIMQLLIIPSIIAAVYCFKLSSRYNRLTQKGVNEKAMWVGLKKYMEDFSMIKDKTVPELILWEKYLVYATAFGIADKVLKQLKVVYPQITDTDYMMSHGYTYMYLMYSHNFNTTFITSLNRSVSTSYNNMTNYSSGVGGGGGFSGGGGFGGGGGRNGRKIKNNKNEL